MEFSLVYMNLALVIKLVLSHGNTYQNTSTRPIYWFVLGLD